MPFLFLTLPPPPGLTAVGPWSAPLADDFKGTLRGRLRVVQGRFLDPAHTVRETAVYLELENVSEAIGPAIEIPFDLLADALHAELKDRRGSPMAQSPGPGSSFVPAAVRVSIPFDSSVRLRANHPGFGSASGLMVSLAGNCWVLKPGTVGYLSGTFTVVAPSGDAGFGKWQGTLKLPPVRLAIPRTLKTAPPR